MILRKHWHIIIVLLLIFNSTSLVAQNTEPSEKALKHLTKEQKTMLAEQQVMIDKAKVTFKNNLTIEQKRILHDKTLARSERSKLLKASLTKKQRSLIDVNKGLLRSKQLKFKRTLTKRQVVRLRRFIKSRDIHDRKRLRRRLRRLIRDNLDSR